VKFFKGMQVVGHMTVCNQLIWFNRNSIEMTPGFWKTLLDAPVGSQVGMGISATWKQTVRGPRPSN
jgi:hypothetical protein